MNVLVTGVGAIIGYGVLKSLKQQTAHRIHIVGMDIYEDAYGQCLCDTFYQAERADSPTYLAFIQRVVEKEKIDLIIPGIEQDMYRLHSLKDSIPTNIALNNDLLIDLSTDKWKAYTFFKEKGINVIPTLQKATYETCKNTLGHPFLLKPRSSYASKGIHIIHSEEAFTFYNKNPEGTIFQHIIGTEQEEYTISVFGKGDGTYADSIILKRILAQTGATEKAKTILCDKVLTDYVDEICAITQPIGPTNIQLRKEGEQAYLLEINPRISSACSIRTHMGYNEPLKCIDYYINGFHSIPEAKKAAYAIRFIDDYYYE